VNECAEGVAVTLRGPQAKKAKTRTNAFGNFELDGLEPGQYSLEIETPGYETKSLEVELKKSEYLREIILARA